LEGSISCPWTGEIGNEEKVWFQVLSLSCEKRVSDMCP
jgi:hypothetical protein